MKPALFIFTTLFISAFALAQEKNKAFVLADGRYALECWGLSVISNSDGTIGREQEYQKGTNLVSSSNGVTSEALVFQSEDETQKYSMTRTTTTEDLGNGLFRQTVRMEGHGRRQGFRARLFFTDAEQVGLGQYVHLHSDC